MHHRHACCVEHGGVFLWASCRGEHDLHALVDENLHQTVNLGIHQRHVHAPRLVGGSLEFGYVLNERFGVHGAGAEQSETAGIAHGSSQSPSAAPHHAALYDGMLYPEELGYSVLFHSAYWVLWVLVLFFVLRSLPFVLL